MKRKKIIKKLDKAAAIATSACITRGAGHPGPRYVIAGAPVTQAYLDGYSDGLSAALSMLEGRRTVIEVPA